MLAALHNVLYCFVIVHSQNLLLIVNFQLSSNDNSFFGKVFGNILFALCRYKRVSTSVEIPHIGIVAENEQPVFQRLCHRAQFVLCGAIDKSVVYQKIDKALLRYAHLLCRIAEANRVAGVNKPVIIHRFGQGGLKLTLKP